MRGVTRWIVGAVINGVIAVCLASITDFPLWIVIVFLVLLDGVPLIWLSGLVPVISAINQKHIFNFCSLIQIVMFMFFVSCLPVVFWNSMFIWGLWALLFCIPAAAEFMHFRLSTMREILEVEKESKSVG